MRHSSFRGPVCPGVNSILDLEDEGPSCRLNCMVSLPVGLLLGLHLTGTSCSVVDASAGVQILYVKIIPLKLLYESSVMNCSISN